MAKQRDRNKKSQAASSKTHVYTSATQHTKLLTDFVNALSALVTASSGLVVQAAAAAVIITGTLVVNQQPASPPLCPDHILMLKDLSVFAAADELFWQAHPEVNRRKILKHEHEFSKEWQGYRKAVEACRQQASP